VARIDGIPEVPDSPRVDSSLHAALIAFVSILTLFILYFLREYDDNSLVSWRWIFLQVDAQSLFITLALGAIAAYMISTLDMPGPGSLFFISMLLGASFINLPEVIIDSSRYFTQAKHLGQFGPDYFFREWGEEIEAWTDLPVMPLVYGLGFRFFGEHRAVVQAIVLLMFSGAVTLTCMLGRDLFGDRAGRLSGMFMLSMPYLYTQVPLMMVDIPSMFFLVLSVYALRMGVLKGGLWSFLWAPLFISIAFFTKYSLWPMLSVMIPVLAILYGQEKKTIKRSILILLVCLLFILPVLWYYRELIASQIDILVSYQKPGLSRWGESLFSTFFFHVHPFVTVAALASLPIAIRRRERWMLPLVWLMLLVLLVLGVRRIRYTIPVLPFFSLMAAYSVNMLGRPRVVRSFAYCALVASFVMALAAYSPFLQTNSLVNLQKAGQYLDSEGIENVSVRAMPQRSVINPEVTVPMLDLYTQARIIYEHRMVPTMSSEKIEKSSFRFTWTYRNPEYYKPEKTDVRTVTQVVVTPETDRVEAHIEPGMELVERYDINDGLFKFRPFVLIYQYFIDK